MHVNASSCALFEVPGIILTLQQQSFTIYTTLDGEWVSEQISGHLTRNTWGWSRAHNQILEATDFNKHTSVRVQSQGQSFGLPDLCSGDYRLYIRKLNKYKYN